jgi:hypothetical protein
VPIALAHIYGIIPNRLLITVCKIVARNVPKDLLVASFSSPIWISNNHYQFPKNGKNQEKEEIK